PFMLGHVQAQLRQVRALDMRRQVQQRLWTTAENIVLEAHLPRRVLEAVWDAFFGRAITSGYDRALAALRPATAAHGMAAGGSSGLLASKGSGRARRYVAGPRLFDAVGASLGVPVPEAESDARAIIVTRLGERIAAEGARRAGLDGRD